MYQPGKNYFETNRNSINFEFQSTFMSTNSTHLADISDIKKMMEKSSRFISLSGLSGIAAGLCALIGAYYAYPLVNAYNSSISNRALIQKQYQSSFEAGVGLLESPLFQMAVYTFIAALLLSFFFTYLRSKKTNTPLWGSVAKRLIIQVAIPMVAGGIFILHLIEQNALTLIAPCCLIFYGLALINASKFTTAEIRYLGYGQLLIGLISLWFPRMGIYFWSTGFGILHLFYGVIMWYKYER